MIPNMNWFVNRLLRKKDHATYFPNGSRIDQKLNSMVSWQQQLSKYVGGGTVKRQINSVGGGVEKIAFFPPHVFLEQP